jgi:hypothetical protein
MAEATNSLQLQQLRSRLHRATRTPALQAAERAIKRKLQAQGLRLSQVRYVELRTRAEAYFVGHRAELIPEAAALVEQWRLNGFFGRRAQCANLNTDAQRRKA